MKQADGVTSQASRTMAGMFGSNSAPAPAPAPAPADTGGLGSMINAAAGRAVSALGG